MSPSSFLGPLPYMLSVDAFDHTGSLTGASIVPLCPTLPAGALPRVYEARGTWGSVNAFRLYHRASHRPHLFA